MSNFKRIVFLTAVVVLIIVNILIYWNTHLYYQAKGIKDYEKKIEILEKAKQFYPLNDLVFYELGRAYYRLGNRNLNDREESETYLRESIENFNLSIKINPLSYFSHYRFAKSLLIMSYLSQSLDVNPYEEFKKSALLLGHRHKISYDVGKILLSQWSELSEEDRNFTLELLRKIVGGIDREKIHSLMQIWEMNVKDYDVMTKILPEDPETYRMYARFLGEKSLSLEERQRFLAEAEFLEFERARSERNSGQDDLLYYRVKGAFNHFRSCLYRLGRIKFYQNLTGKSLINSSEFDRLQKSAVLNLAKCNLEEGKELKEVKDYLQKYLSLEDKVAAANELESYLRLRGLLGEELGTSFGDLDRLSFQLFLYFKQNRYRDIVRLGRLLQQSFVAVPQGKREEYVTILQLLGDSYQKIDFIYDAGEFYQRALEIDAENLQTLLKIRVNYERLNENEKVGEIQERIDELLSQKEIVLKDLNIHKSKSASHTLVLDGRKIVLDFHFKDGEEWISSLITVFFNGRVVWEDYLKDEVLSLPLESKVGKNLLEIAAVNRGISLVRLAYR